MIAHRGVSGLEMENTCAAFVAAGNRSYYGIETDVHKTKDGRFVIIHDDTTGRVFGTDLSVEGSDFAALRALRRIDRDGKADRADLVIPTLEEYAGICVKYGKYSILELKNRFEREEIGQIIDILREVDALPTTVFISFCYENLQSVRSFLPDARAQFLCGELSTEMEETLIRDGIDVDMYSPHVTRELVARLHEAGREVNVWTPDDPAVVTELLELGVDYVTSNICE